MRKTSEIMEMMPESKRSSSVSTSFTKSEASDPLSFSMKTEEGRRESLSAMKERM